MEEVGVPNNDGPVKFCLLSQEKLLLQPRYDIPGSRICEVIIDEHVVSGKSEPKYVYAKDDDDSASATHDKVDTTAAVSASPDARPSQQQSTSPSASFSV